MTFRNSTTNYEKWLSGELELVPADLKRKHETMRAALFPFFRATFYRWSQLFPEVCPECVEAPELLSVGDLHVENFGTWRDIEGRLVWGINDFDEVTRMPYTIDLVRLAASAHIAVETEQLRVAPRDACGQILAGYKEGIEAGGKPWVLGERHQWLYEMVKPILRDPVAFWEKLKSLPVYEDRIPGSARRGIAKMMPRDELKFHFAHRVAGMGSLGRQRFIGIADFEGGPVCREAKALAPSAWDWARGKDTDAIRYQKILDSSVRAHDPFVRLQRRWIVRRLAPDCSKIDLAHIPREKDETRLLHAMGWETANVHLGSGRAKQVLADLVKRPEHWLHKAASDMTAATQADWKEWHGAPKKAAATGAR